MAVIPGTPRDDILVGGPESDEFIASNGNDRLDGGAGAPNSLNYSSYSSPVSLRFTGVGSGISAVVGGSTVFANITTILGGSAGDVLVGAAGDETLYGQGGNDQLSGGEGNDVLAGGAGNDTLDGGAGRDVAVFGVASTSAAWTRSGASWTVTAGSDGTDTLTGVEVLRFTDRDVTLPPNRNDVDSDGRGDVLWQNTNGAPSVWAMQGGTVRVYLNYPNPGASWRFVGAADLNGDGQSDLLWQKNDGLPSSWLLAGGGASLASTPVFANPSTSWRLVGGADLDGDGRAEFVWQNSSTGAVSAWIFAQDGASVTKYVNFSNPGTSWRLIGMGDLNGDKRSDLVFQNASGAVSAWLMGGSLGAPDVATYANFDNPGPSWSLVGTGDLNGDGRDDLLFQNTSSGLPSAWLVSQDGQSTASRPVFSNPGTDWRLVGATDANADGRADLLWQRQDGLPSLWLIGAGGTSVDSTPVLNNPGADWRVLPDRSGAPAKQDDVSGTGRGSLVWQNADGRPSVWALQGGSVGAYLNYPNPGANWRLVGTADLNGDGRSDLLWQKDDGLPSGWLVGQGGRSVDGNPVYSNPGASWRLVGGADLDGDGQADLLWQNQNGAVSAWITAPGGTGVAAYVNFDNPGTSWRLVGAGDLNGDGRSDLVFQNTSGAVSAWLMGGSLGAPTVSTYANFSNPGADWHLVGTGDLNGDGRDDLLYQNTSSGLPSAWLMGQDGASVTGYPTFTNPGTSWRLVGATDANGDGRDDLVWQNASGSPSLWLTGAGGTSVDSYPVLDNPGADWRLV